MEDQTRLKQAEEAIQPEPQERNLSLPAAIGARLRAHLQSRVALAVFLGLTAVAVVAEPFDTHGALPLLPRILYWALVVGVSVFVGSVCDEISLWTTRTGSWAAPLKAAALMALSYGPFVVLVSQVFNFFGASFTGYPLETISYVLVVSCTVFAVIHVLRPYLKNPEEEAPGAPPEPELTFEVETERPRLSARLDCPEVTIYRVSASDHMTEVATNHGIERIRMRFADAVLEMEPVEGVCVHRSHWVALDAVDGLVRRDGRPFVQLVNGEELPVSRTYRPRLEEAMPELF